MPGRHADVPHPNGQACARTLDYSSLRRWPAAKRLVVFRSQWKQLGARTVIIVALTRMIAAATLVLGIVLVGG
jgi:hypothetical protein